LLVGTHKEFLVAGQQQVGLTQSQNLVVGNCP
jgi:hypothetical protein